MSDLIKQLRVNSGWRDRNWQCITDPARLLEAADEIERLTAEVRRLDHSTTHTCWDECPRLACAQRREIDALTAQLAVARESERAAVVAYLRGYFVGTDYANAIEAGEHLT